MYYLAQKESKHKKGVRCCCVLQKSQRLVTGSCHGEIIIWNTNSPVASSSSSTQTCTFQYTVEFEYSSFHFPIYALHDDTLKVFVQQEPFFFAAIDKTIHWLSISGKTHCLFEGHTSPVCSFASFIETSLPSMNCEPTGYLVSGSWDGTACIWNLRDQCVVHVLRDHSYAVTVFAFIYDFTPYIITGSQDRCLRWWSGKTQFQSPELCSPQAHDDIIRGFALLSPDEIVTCSNDGYAKVWSLKEKTLQATYQLHDSFIFHICVAENKTTKNPFRYLISSSEDATCRVWDTQKKPWTLLQILHHPCTVWGACIILQNDLVTVCEDSHVRMWTMNKERQLSVDLQHTDHLQSYTLNHNLKNEKIEVDKLPSKEQLLSTPGTVVGQYKLCRDNTTVFAMSWNGTQWELLGEVMNPNGPTDTLPTTKQEYYEGDSVFPAGYYDFIFHIDIEASSVPKRLPFRLSDNVHKVAELFCSRENISKIHTSTIVQFINTNSNQHIKTPPLATPANKTEENDDFTLRDYISFESVNIKGLRAALCLETEETRTLLGLSPLQIQYFNSLLKSIEQEHFLTHDLRQCDVEVAFLCQKNNTGDSFLALIDVWRILLLHPQSSDILRRPDILWKHISLVLKNIQKTCNNPSSLTVCCYRFLTNFFVVSTNRNLILRYAFEVAKVLDTPPLNKSSVIFGWAATVSNFCLALYQSSDLIISNRMNSQMTSTQTLHNILLSLTKAFKVILQQKQLALKLVYTMTLTLGTIMHLLISHPSQNNASFTCLFIDIIGQLNTLCTTFQDANLSSTVNRLPNLLDSLVS